MPKCRVVADSLRYRRKALRNLSFDGERLVVDLQGEGFAYVRLTFESVVGFRMLDERDLREFWNEYSQPNGWLYEVESGGWLELESTRPSFSAPELMPGLKEYFIVDEQCVSVLCHDAPRLVDLGTDPGRRP